MMAERYLLADLGGTNTRLVLAGDCGLDTGTLRRYRNADFDSFEAVLAAYLDDLSPGPLHALCAGVAGPVLGATAQLTNYAWQIDAAALRDLTGAPHIHLVNDLQVQGFALDDLPPDAVTPIFPGQPASPDAPRLVLNLGTGCNVAVVHRRPEGLFVPAAESGHSALPHASGRIGALFDHLRETYPHLPIEAALSGPGLANIHAYLTGARLSPVEISTAATQGDPAARDTLALFCETLGLTAGNFALHHLPAGGLYLTGSLARVIAPHLPASAFLSAFTARGPYTDIVRAIPVFAVTDDSVPLLGCYRYLRQALKD
ncbi:MAG: glucokinase [Roseovarius sp.]